VLRLEPVAFRPFALRYANGGVRCNTSCGIGAQGLGDRQAERPFDVTGIEDEGIAAGEGQAELPVDLRFGELCREGEERPSPLPA